MNKKIKELLDSHKCKTCSEPTVITNKKSFVVNRVRITKYELTCSNGHKNLLEIKN